MAFESLGTYKVFEWEQEEIIDKKQVVNEEGIVEDVEELLQSYAKVWAELNIEQNRLPELNKSEFRAILNVFASAGENGNGFGVKMNVGDYKTHPVKTGSYVCIDDKFYDRYRQQFVVYDETYTVAPGNTFNSIACEFDTSNKRLLSYSDTVSTINYKDASGFHRFSGEFGGVFWDKTSSNGSYLNFTGEVNIHLYNLLRNGAYTDAVSFEETFSIKPTPLNIESRAVVPITANNFTDEENASFTYSAEVGSSVEGTATTFNVGTLTSNSIVSLKAALSFDGETADIAYRDIPINSTSYTFNFTDAEREILREKAQGASTVPIYYLIKVNRAVNGTGREWVSATQRAITIVGAKPTLNPTIKDIKPETIALTGNENIFVRYESMVEFATGAVASKGASIISQSVTCGSKTIYNLYQGIIDDIEDGTFIFNATDSRGLHADTVAITNAAMIEYIKPTCKQEVSIELNGETGATVSLKITGEYYNGSFGAANNELTLEVRYQEGSGSMSDWMALGAAALEGNTYKITTSFTGLDYDKAYTFQCRAIDKLNTVNSSQYTARLLPVFDWSETDFNFNVPIKLDNQTVLRHTVDTNNTVLSASGGHIYIRPKGTDKTDGESIIYPDGRIKFGNSIDLSNGFTINGNSLADYVIESGSEAMGSNGTWYWCKWASGKAECWGCRNFGNMAVTTAWGGLYRSAILTQDLPDGVFKTTPDVININIVNANFGGWICKHENLAPSAVTTGSFIYVRPASATISPSYIGFHVIGVWQ